MILLIAPNMSYVKREIYLFLWTAPAHTYVLDEWPSVSAVL